MTAKCRYLQCVFTFLFVVVTNSFAGGWVQVSELPTLRVGMATAVVNGKIYLIGGYNRDENLGGSAPALASMDVYDTRVNTWRKTADMPTPRIIPQAVVFSSEIYVFGGYDRTRVRGDFYKKIVEMYDARTNTWTRMRDMPTLRRNFSAAIVDGMIFLIGGTVYDKILDRQVATDLVEAYDPLTDRWEKRLNMPTKRSRTDAAVVDGKVYVIGGEVPLPGLGLADSFLQRIEEYNPRTDQWRRLPDMPMFKFSFATVAVDNEIYTIGGYTLNNGFQLRNAVDVYNPAFNKWRSTKPIQIAKTATATVVNGTIYLLGGFIGNGRYSPVVEAFDTGFRAVSAKDKRSTRWGSLKKPQ